MGLSTAAAAARQMEGGACATQSRRAVQGACQAAKGGRWQAQHLLFQRQLQQRVPVAGSLGLGVADHCQR